MFPETMALSLLGQRIPDHALPRAFYTDPDVLELDLETIWYRDWLFAIPACEIPQDRQLRHGAGRRLSGRHRARRRRRRSAPSTIPAAIAAAASAPR